MPQKTRTSKDDLGTRADPNHFEEGAIERMLSEGGHGDDPDTRGRKERGIDLVQGQSNQKSNTKAH